SCSWCRTSRWSDICGTPDSEQPSTTWATFCWARPFCWRGEWPVRGSCFRFGFLPHGAVSGVGEWPVRAEGARSGGPQGTHGGFPARFARAPSRPSAVLPRSASASRGRSPGASAGEKTWGSASWGRSPGATDQSRAITRREAPFGASHTQCESACKPDSVEDGHPSGPHVTAGLLRPTRDSIGGPPASLLGLAPGGVCRAGPVARSAGGLLLHPFTLACARRPSAVCSLLHFPSGHPAWELPSTLPCGVRTFLGLSTATVQRTRNVKSIG